MKKCILILIYLTTSLSFSQKLNDDYMLFSNDEYHEYIEFKNDTLLIRKPYYPENYCFVFSQKLNYNTEIYKEYNYIRKDNTITIKDFEGKVNSTLKITEEEYFESSDKVYVLRSKFEKFPKISLRFENQTFQLNSNSITNNSGKKTNAFIDYLKKNKYLTSISKPTNLSKHLKSSAMNSSSELLI